MLHLAFLLLAQAAAGEAPILKAELKEVPATEKTKGSLVCEGSTNLPNGALLQADLYYRIVDEGKSIDRPTISVQDGKFVQEFQPYPRKIFPGKYIVRLRFNPALQNPAVNFSDARLDVPFQVGNEADFQREAAFFRGQLAGELREMVGLGEELKGKIKELEGKPADEWKELLKKWESKSHEIMHRADPRRVPEYNVLKIDHPATTGLENLAGILTSAAKYAAAGRGKEALEGITVLRQTAEYLIGEMTSPKLTTAAEVLELLDAARKLLQEAAAKPDQPVLPARRKFLEMNALLQKSLPEDMQPMAIEIGSVAARFFSALADQETNVKELLAEMEKTLEKLAGPLRSLK